MTRSNRLAMLAWVALPQMARAQASCPGTASDAATTPARQWPAPLDRLVTLHERELSLRDALDQLAAAARVRLAYSADLLPLDRRVCAVYRSVAVGTALTDVLEGVAVERVVVTGTVNGSAQRAVPVALDVIDGRELQRRDAHSLSNVLNGAVPGVW